MHTAGGPLYVDQSWVDMEDLLDRSPANVRGVKLSSSSVGRLVVVDIIDHSAGTCDCNCDICNNSIGNVCFDFVSGTFYGFPADVAVVSPPVRTLERDEANQVVIHRMMDKNTERSLYRVYLNFCPNMVCYCGVYLCELNSSLFL